MRTLVFAMLAAFAGNAVGVAQPKDSTRFDPTGHYEVYTGDGERTDLDTIVARMGGVFVVFLGEQHNDPTAHALELTLLQAAHHEYRDSRRLVLGMEMFEHDVQPVLDEYLSGHIRETDFLKASRPWGRYETDYRPLVEFAKEFEIPVIATNAPSRYVSLARRRGLAALDSLMSSWFSLPHETHVPDVSYLIDAPSAEYEAKFRAEMADMGDHGSMPGMPSVDDMLVAQNLRDATMAFWITNGAFMKGVSLLLHVNGSFHSENRLGIPEHLAFTVPLGSGGQIESILVITMRPVDNIQTPPEPSNDDFIILTDKALIPDE